MLCIVPVVVVAVICVSLPLSLSLPLFDFLDRCGRHGVAQRHATALVACSIPIPDIGSRFFFQEAFESKQYVRTELPPGSSCVLLGTPSSNSVVLAL